MYARGMTVREIRGHLEELYGIDVSPDLISAVTDAVLDEVRNGRTGPSISATRWCSSSRSEEQQETHSEKT
jgi:transposase-like protein